MKKVALLLSGCLVMYCATCRPPTSRHFKMQQQPSLTIDVNEGIELLSVIQYLGGQLSNSTPSVYKTALKKYFLPYRSHAAVTTMFLFDNTIYPDMVEWGILFYNYPDIKMRAMPDSSSWYKYIPKDVLHQYFLQCIQFYKDTKFHAFYASHHNEYAAWAASLKTEISEPIKIFNQYFNQDKKYSWTICLDPLNDWGAHTIIPSTITNTLPNCIIYQLGYMGDVDSAKQMVFKTDVYDIAWHEGTHAVTDNILKAYKTSIDSLSPLLKTDDALKKQNITDWQHYFNELIARSVSIALHKKYRSNADYERLLQFETGRGFIHAKDVSDIIYDEFINERKYQYFEDVLPDVFKELKSKYNN